jgi:hypothetical protein
LVVHPDPAAWPGCVQDNPYLENMNKDLHYRGTLHSIKPQWQNLLNFDIVSCGINLKGRANSRENGNVVSVSGKNKRKMGLAEADPRTL